MALQSRFTVIALQ